MWLNFSNFFSISPPLQTVHAYDVLIRMENYLATMPNKNHTFQFIFYLKMLFYLISNHYKLIYFYVKKNFLSIKMTIFPLFLFHNSMQDTC